MTSLRILGPVEAWHGDQRLAVGGPRQLTLLAFLILHANRAVSRDALVDAVWGPTRRDADNRLQMAIARLRKALEPLNGELGPALQTVSGGYLLAIAPGELDADAFQAEVHAGIQALDAGAPEKTVALLGQAMELWRGPPLADVAFEDFAQSEIRRLEELRIRALECRIDAELQLGRHAEVIGELEALMSEAPTREHLAGQLMIALYRCGRQADALDVYQRVRVTLAEAAGHRTRARPQVPPDRDPRAVTFAQPGSGARAAGPRRCEAPRRTSAAPDSTVGVWAVGVRRPS